MKICYYYVTLRCNASCEFCDIWRDEEKYQGILEKPCPTAFLQTLGIKHVNLTGGEPLLREDLAQILRDLKAVHFTTELTTNGLLYAAKAESINGLVDTLNFSIDYPFPEEHDRSRGVECFAEVLEAVKLAKELGEKPQIYFTVHRDNVQFLPEMVDLSQQLKVGLYLNPVYDFYGTQGFSSTTLSSLLYFARRKHVYLDLAAVAWMRAGGNHRYHSRCRAKETTVTILPDGRLVQPCFFNQRGKQGQEEICRSCMRWPYMLPSFSTGFDKYRFLHEWSQRKRRFL